MASAKSVAAFVCCYREEETVYSYIYFACRCRHAHIVWSANRTLCIPSAGSRANLHTRALLYLSPWYYAVANGRRKKASCFAPHMRRRHNRFWTRICACWIICTKRRERSAENEHRTQPGAHDTEIPLRLIMRRRQYIGRARIIIERP